MPCSQSTSKIETRSGQRSQLIWQPGQQEKIARRIDLDHPPGGAKGARTGASSVAVTKRRGTTRTPKPGLPGIRHRPDVRASAHWSTACIDRHDLVEIARAHQRRTVHAQHGVEDRHQVLSLQRPRGLHSDPAADRRIDHVIDAERVLQHQADDLAQLGIDHVQCDLAGRIGGERGADRRARRRHKRACASLDHGLQRLGCIVALRGQPELDRPCGRRPPLARGNGGLGSEGLRRLCPAPGPFRASREGAKHRRHENSTRQLFTHRAYENIATGTTLRTETLRGVFERSTERWARA